MGRFKSGYVKEASHWMHTSAILIGSGIRGDQVTGAYDNNLFLVACGFALWGCVQCWGTFEARSSWCNTPKTGRY